MKITWLVQAGLLFEICGKIILIDPHLSDNVENYEPANDRRMSIDDFFLRIKPNVIVITHNHFDKCVLLNTYLSSYFEPCGYIKFFDIYFEVDAFDNNFSMYQNIKNVKCPNIEYQSYPYKYQLKAGYEPYHNSLFVNRLVLENTEAGEKVEQQANCEYTKYLYVFKELSENLKKEASGK